MADIQIGNNANLLKGAIDSHDIHNVSNVDNSVTNNIVNNTYEAQRTEIEILQANENEFLKAVQERYADGILTSQEMAELQQIALMWKIEPLRANQIIEQVSKSIAVLKGGQGNEFFTRQILEEVFNALQINEVEILKRKFRTLEQVARTSIDDNIQYYYHMLFASFSPENCIEALVNSQIDNYWQIYWAHIAYVKLGSIDNATALLPRLGGFGYPQGDTVLLMAIDNIAEYCKESKAPYYQQQARQYLEMACQIGMSEQISPLWYAAQMVLSEDKASEVWYRFYGDITLKELECVEGKCVHIEKEELALYDVVVVDAGDQISEVAKIVKEIAYITISEANDLLKNTPVSIVGCLEMSEALDIKKRLINVGASVEVVVSVTEELYMRSGIYLCGCCQEDGKRVKYFSKVELNEFISDNLPKTSKNEDSVGLAFEKYLNKIIKKNWGDADKTWLQAEDNEEDGNIYWLGAEYMLKDFYIPLNIRNMTIKEINEAFNKCVGDVEHCDLLYFKKVDVKEKREKRRNMRVEDIYVFGVTRDLRVYGVLKNDDSFDYTSIDDPKVISEHLWNISHLDDFSYELMSLCGKTYFHYIDKKRKSGYSSERINKLIKRNLREYDALSTSDTYNSSLCQYMNVLNSLEPNNFIHWFKDPKEVREQGIGALKRENICTYFYVDKLLSDLDDRISRDIETFMSLKKNQIFIVEYILDVIYDQREYAKDKEKLKNEFNAKVAELEIMRKKEEEEQKRKAEEEKRLMEKAMEAVYKRVKLSKNKNMILEVPKDIKEFVVLDSINSIGDNAFKDCTSLQSIIIPDGVTSIGKSAFQGCTKLVSVTIANSVRSIGSGAFSECISLRKVSLPNSIRYINDRVFYKCESLEQIDIPESISSIGGHCFSDCTSLKKVVLPVNLEEISGGAFARCSSLQSITIPKSVKEISCNAFEECKFLRSVTMPEGIVEIKASAFEKCISLQSVTIPASVTKIEYDAFYGCKLLRDVYIKGNPEYVPNMWNFENKNPKKLLDVFRGSPYYERNK